MVSGLLIVQWSNCTNQLRRRFGGGRLNVKHMLTVFTMTMFGKTHISILRMDGFSPAWPKFWQFTCQTPANSSSRFDSSDKVCIVNRQTQMAKITGGSFFYGALYKRSWGSLLMGLSFSLSRLFCLALLPSVNWKFKSPTCCTCWCTKIIVGLEFMFSIMRASGMYR